MSFEVGRSKILFLADFWNTVSDSIAFGLLSVSPWFLGCFKMEEYPAEAHLHFKGLPIEVYNLK